MTTLQQKLAELSPERLAIVEALVEQLIGSFTDEELRDELNRRNTIEYTEVQPAEVRAALDAYNDSPIHCYNVAGRQMRHGLGREGARSQFSRSLISSIGDVHMDGLDKMNRSEAAMAITSRCNSILESRSRSKHI